MGKILQSTFRIIFRSYSGEKPSKNRTFSSVTASVWSRTFNGTTVECGSLEVLNWPELNEIETVSVDFDWKFVDILNMSNFKNWAKLNRNQNW